MGPKKRKLSDGRDVETSDSTVIKIKKRKRTELDAAELIQELYETIRNHKTDDGRLLCEEFIRAPKRRNDPEYYNVISSPMDLLKVQHKLKSDEYKGLEDFTADIETLVNNTKAYYKEDSQEFSDISELWELFSESKTVLLGEELTTYGVDEEDDEDEEDEEDDDEEETFVAAKADKMEVDGSREEVKVLYPDSSSIVIPGIGGNPTIKLKMPSSPMPTAVVEDVPNVVSEVVQANDEVLAATEQVEKMMKEDEGVAKVSETGRSLRERRYTYRDFLFPKVTISEKQEEPGKDKEADKDDRDERSSLTGDDDDTLEEMFGSVVTATDGGRCISDMFKILPSRKKYPDYYEVIHDPMDLKTVARRIQNSEYKTLDDMVRDLNQMVYNAKMFNEPGSQIYRDAITLKKLVMNKKHEMDLQSNLQRPVRSQRIRSRKANAGQRLSQVIGALESDSDKEEPRAPPRTTAAVEEYESGEDEAVNETDDDPLWVLFRAVKGQKNSLGQRMSEPFLRLPNKRMYPDYYNEIKKPMSLLKIQKKLKNNQYRDFDHLINDLDLVFENAKHYNIDESKLYKDTVKLHSVMKAKVKEIKEELQESEITIKLTKGRRSFDALSTASGTSEEGGKKKIGRKSASPEEQIRRRLWSIYKAVSEYTFDGRPLIAIFVTVPSKKDYPDYYQVISEPIDMTMIENKIKLDKYTTEQALIADLELMFNNARHYNEENSQLYKDAEKLERILTSKVRSMPSVDGGGVIKTPGRNKPKTKSASTLTAKLQDLYNTIRDYSDARKRVLSTPFMKLPLKSEYPDYYEIIKRPMDMQKIFQRMISHQYPSVEEMVSDIVLMFDNACKYNEPDSLIYKDALTLQRVCLEKKTELSADDYSNEVPDVRAQVTELMTNLFISTFNHMDEEGRCYSDSFMELPSKITVEDPDSGEDREKPAPTFEKVKRNLDRGRYRRMDRFQEDMFEVFKFARTVSRTDSQVYEDSIELQMFFIRIRDELCKNGEVLLTPSLSYRETHLHKDLEQERHEKTPLEQRADEEKTKKQPEGGINDPEEEVSTKEEPAGKIDCVEFKEQTYVVGDFVYIEPRDKTMVDPHIVCIERMWKEDTGEQWLYGCWFLRPNETYHLATRKFLEKELFKSDFYDSVPFGKVMSKCHVMSVRDYFKMKPEGYADRDVYVCESRYSGRTKAFKKIKNWQLPKNDALKLVPRDQPFSQIRVASVFAEKAMSEERGVDDGLMDILDKERQVVVLEAASATEEGFTTYEQYQTHTTWIKLGDHVYVKTDSQDTPLIIGVDKIWTDSNGDTFIHGPLFVHPADVEHAPTRLFYKREVFRSSTEHTCHVSDVTGRCAVLTHKEYLTSRPTEVTECDIYICEAKYIESEKAIKKFSKPVKKPSLSITVCDDEILFFRKPIVPHKEPSPLLMKVSEDQMLGDFDSNTMDSSYSENLSYQGDNSMQEAPIPEPVSEKKKKQKIKGRNMTGYIMFAAEYRKEIAEGNPEMSFGEISKVVGARWKALDKEVKEKYEDRAKISVAESIAKQAEADRAFNESLNNYPPSQSPGGDHSMSPGPSGGYHQSNGYHGFSGQLPPGGLMGQQGMAPYPAQGHPSNQTSVGPQGIVRHGYPGAVPQHPNQMMNQHIVNGTPQMMYPNTPTSVHSGQAAGQTQTMPPPPPPKPPSPMFVSVPPKTQRLVHSEAYLRYIENLTPESRTVGNWDRSLAATPENTPIQTNTKLPVHWLANGVGHHESAANALWALRDLMMKDAVTISRTLEFSQL